MTHRAENIAADYVICLLMFNKMKGIIIAHQYQLEILAGDDSAVFFRIKIKSAQAFHTVETVMGAVAELYLGYPFRKGFDEHPTNRTSFFVR